VISPENDFAIWTVLLLICYFGIYGERKGWFKKISGALVIIIVGGVFSSMGIIPSASDPSIDVEVYNWVFTYFIPLSIPLLLFNVGIKKMIKETGNLLGPFLIGAFGVVIGALVAYYLIDLGEESHKIAGTFIGTYTGGSVNFMAVATSLNFLESPLFPSVIAVDNVFTNLYIILLFALPGFSYLANLYPEEDFEIVEIQKEEIEKTNGLSMMEQLCVCLLVSSLIFLVSSILGPILSQMFQTDIDLKILLITIVIIICVNLAPGFFQKYEKMAYDLGMLMMYVFLAVIGAASDLKELVSSSPGVLVMATIILMIHLIVILIGSRLFNVSLKEIMIASCANVGGPSVAAPMAISFGMKKAVTPAILISLMGYVIGTFLGIGTGLFLG